MVETAPPRDGSGDDAAPAQTIPVGEDAEYTLYMEEEIMVATQTTPQDMTTKPFTVVGTFNGPTDAEFALRALQDAGFSRDQVSMVTRNRTGEAVPGEHETARDAEIGGAGLGVLGGVAGWLLGISALAIPVVGDVIGIGILWATLAGAGIGVAAGGIGGALVGHGVDDRHAREYEEHVRQGRTLMTVHTATQAQQQQARDILDRAGSANVRTYGQAAS